MGGESAEGNDSKSANTLDMSKGLKSKGALTINRKNEEKKHILKGINKDVAKFLKDVDSVTNAALINTEKEQEDNKSSLSGFSKNTNPESQIMKDINDAFSTSTTKTKTKAEILLE